MGYLTSFCFVVVTLTATNWMSGGLTQTPPCSSETEIPSDVQAIANGTITAAQTSFTKTFSAGQKAFVKLTNVAPPHITGVKVRFFAKLPGGGQKDECLTQLLVIPGKPSILSHSVFGTKVTYNVEVSLATDVDAANIGINVTATKP